MGCPSARRRPVFHTNSTYSYNVYLTSFAYPYKIFLFRFSIFIPFSSYEGLLASPVSYFGEVLPKSFCLSPSVEVVYEQRIQLVRGLTAACRNSATPYLRPVPIGIDIIVIDRAESVFLKAYMNV